MNNPTENEIKEWVENKTTQWFLERLAWHLNTIDTIRDITPENLNTALARKIALEIVENALADIYTKGEIHQYQKKVSEEEDNIIKRLKEIKTDY